MHSDWGTVNVRASHGLLACWMQSKQYLKFQALQNLRENNTKMQIQALSGTFPSINIVCGYSHRMRSTSKMGYLCLCIIAQRRGISTQFLHFKSLFCLTSKIFLEPPCENQDVITLCAEWGVGEKPDSGLKIFPFPDKKSFCNFNSNISCNSL